MLRDLFNVIKDKEFKINFSFGKVNVINYQDIIDFNDEKIVLSVGQKKINIIGRNLVVSKLMDHELLVVGDILQIDFR